MFLRQQKLLDKIGTRFVFPADEMVLISGKELPPEEEYEGYPQLENGVGLLQQPSRSTARTEFLTDGVMRTKPFFTRMAGNVVETADEIRRKR